VVGKAVAVAPVEVGEVVGRENRWIVMPGMAQAVLMAQAAQRERQAAVAEMARYG
jgi:hypothetical protein